MAEQNKPPILDWQTERSTVLERNSFMFLNDLMSDIHFQVGEHVFPSHKYVLGTSSPVFFAMFFGPMAEQSAEIKITDSDPEAFKELLRFLYTDQAELNDSVVGSVIYLAEKYMIPALKRLCITFLKKNLSVVTALKYLPLARQYNENELAEKCRFLIRQYTGKIIEREDFTEIPADMLKALLKEENLSVREIEIFRAANRWAEARCVEAGEVTNGPNKRRRLGDCVELIRFPTMSSDELVSEVFSNEMLGFSEIVDVSCTFKKSSDWRRSRIFNDSARNSKFLRCRFDIQSSSGEVSADGCRWYGQRFSVDTSINVIGFGVIGGNDGPTTVRELFIFQEDSSYRLAQITGREFTSILKTDSRGTSYPGFDVLLEQPVKIQPGKKYIVQVELSGSIIEFDVKILDTRTVNGIQFNLEKSRFFNLVISEIIFKTIF